MEEANNDSGTAYRETCKVENFLYEYEKLEDFSSNEQRVVAGTFRLGLTNPIV